jgi:hypothetical protein
MTMLSSRDIVKLINESLETTWSELEWVEGKKIDVLSEWRGRMKFIMGEYRKAGWDVKREIIISTDVPFYDDYLIFRNPSSFQACPPELRSAGM